MRRFIVIMLVILGLNLYDAGDWWRILGLIVIGVAIGQAEDMGARERRGR